jgi:hypothetical protein
MAKRRTIGETPLDTVVSAPGALLEEKPKRRAPKPVPLPLLTRLTDLLERLGQDLTKFMAQEAELRNLQAEVERLKAETAELRQAQAPCLCVGLLNRLKEKLSC